MQIKSKLNHQIDLALKEKYQQVYDLVSVYQEPPSNKNGSNNSNNDSNSDNNHNNDDDIVQLVQENQRALTRMRVQLPAKRELLNKLITRFVKITLEVLDTVWAIIREFKCDDEEKKNASFDAYYCALTDSLLLRIKILHISTLLSTYDSDLVSALQSLRTILENRYLDARTQLSFAEKKIQAYQDMGPEFETLADAYFKLLEDIKATEDDIRRIKNN
ncbi:HAUS augmin-like complex subunit 4 [Phascolomyces articulosus]|uniref:HAUS augmin-like complex subunit 4 n=1 Tax=Phascolomyces articulosus TaxID=60185 RepID=A0AAD5PM67_9FUNG|nr:HAUS augmin-like complex subunit 4 [Phascolomyces articulosus]